MGTSLPSSSTSGSSGSCNEDMTESLEVFCMIDAWTYLAALSDDDVNLGPIVPSLGDVFCK